MVDKPAGISVEADGDSVVKRLARELGPPGGRAWPRVVHRLDSGTSGCLAIALNQRGEKALATSFLEGEVEKEYFAIVIGSAPDHGQFDTAYGPDPRDPRRHTTRIETPRRARLSWKLVERFAYAALVRVRLETGRTHQIRVQFSEGGFPVLGDATYGEANAVSPIISRPALHAASLAFPDPDGDGLRKIRCEAPLPADLQSAIESLRAVR